MITLEHENRNLSGYTSMLNKLKKNSLKINPFMIDEDIKRLKSMLKRPFNTSDRANIEGIIKYITNLGHSLDENDCLTLNWVCDKGRTKSSPVSMEAYPQYGIRSYDYILLEDKNMVKVDFTDVYKILAFEMMHRDMGLETMEVDSMLDDVGIATVVPSEKIISIVDKNCPDILDCSKKFMISDSQFASPYGRLSWDYFGFAHNEFEAFKSGRYADCVGYSIDAAASIINRSIIEKLLSTGVDFNICYLGEYGLHYMIDGSVNVQNLIDRKCFDSVIIRSFGRRFEVNPKITVM